MKPGGLRISLRKENQESLEVFRAGSQIKLFEITLSVGLENQGHR